MTENTPPVAVTVSYERVSGDGDSLGVGMCSILVADEAEAAFLEDLVTDFMFVLGQKLDKRRETTGTES